MTPLVENSYGVAKRLEVVEAWLRDVAARLAKSRLDILDYGCGTGDHLTAPLASLGLTIDSQSKPEHLARLQTLEVLHPLTQFQVELARRYAHAVFRCRPWEMRSFRTVKAPLDQTGHPLDANLIPHVCTFADCAAAADLQAFAAWVDSDDVDFLCLDAATDRVCAAF